jgi:hypothetical protein
MSTVAAWRCVLAEAPPFWQWFFSVGSCLTRLKIVTAGQKCFKMHDCTLGSLAAEPQLRRSRMQREHQFHFFTNSTDSKPVSRLTDLIAKAKASDPQLGADLEREFRALSSRLSFGLNFERHRPEAVELPQRPVRRGDKVRVLPPRGSTAKGRPAAVASEGHP